VHPRIGIGSFAYRYAIGIRGFGPEQPMTLRDFLGVATRDGWSGVQLCENLVYSSFSDADLAAAAAQAGRLQLFVEIGLNGLSDRSLSRHLDIAAIFNSDLVRVVVGTTGVDETVRVLRSALPRLRRQNVTLGLENHFDLTTDQLLGIVRQLDDEHVGIIFDTTNGLGFLEKPEAAIVRVEPYLVSMHIKDYTIQKVEAGYFVTGSVLGKGLLDLEVVLRRAIRAPHLRSLMLEMSIKRDEANPVETVVQWEQEAILASRRHLLRELERVQSS
jgi:sugar phosphate isomerase/epimerase